MMAVGNVLIVARNILFLEAIASLEAINSLRRCFSFFSSKSRILSKPKPLLNTSSSQPRLQLGLIWIGHYTTTTSPPPQELDRWVLTPVQLILSLPHHFFIISSMLPRQLLNPSLTLFRLFLNTSLSLPWHFLYTYSTFSLNFSDTSLTQSEHFLYTCLTIPWLFLETFLTFLWHFIDTAWSLP